MAEIVELERRIAAALERIGRGLDGLARPSPAPLPDSSGESASDPAPVDAAEAPMLLDAAEAPGIAPAAPHPAEAELATTLQAAAEREAMIRAQYEDRIEKLTRQLDVQGLELQRMRKTAVTLREELRRLRESETARLTEPGQINRAMLAELDALRAARLSELAELDELSAALDDHLTEAEHA